MSLLESPPLHSPEALERKVYSGDIGSGRFDLEIFQAEGLPERGGVLFLQAPGLFDEDAFSRRPLAEAVAGLSEAGMLIRSGIIKHARGSVAHAREQRSMNVHGATKLAEDIARPDLVVLLGNSFGGNNVNDSVVHEVNSSGRERGNAPIVVIQEVTPGVREPFHIHSPFNLDVFRRIRGGVEAVRHPSKTIGLNTHEASRLISSPHQTPVRIAELRVLSGICIADGVRRLDRAGIPVISIDNREDQLVPKREGHVIMDGGHLHSYFEPEDMTAFIRDTVVPMTTSRH